MSTLTQEREPSYEPHPKHEREERLFAALCPDTLDYFLVPESEAFAPELRSRYTSKPIPAESRFVQYMPRDNLIVFDDAYLAEVLPLIREAEAQSVEPATFQPSPLTLTNDFLPDLQRHALATRQALVSPELESTIGGAAVLDAAVAFGELSERTAFLNSYYAVHNVSFDTVGGWMYVFNVGEGGGLIFGLNVGVLASLDLEAAEKLFLYGALILEIVGLVGVILGIKTQPQKAADAIQEALRKRPIIQAFERLITGLRNGTKSIIDFCVELIKVLYNEGALGAILSAALAGALGIVGILYLIASLLLKLVPGLGWAVTAAQIAAQGAGIVLKINKVFSA
jgi:hypothetical protein